MPKDLQALIDKAEKALPKGKSIDVEVKTKAIDDPKESVVTKKSATQFKEASEGPDEPVQKHAEEAQVTELLEDRDRRVGEGMDLLLSAADSILSAKRCGREDQS